MTSAHDLPNTDIFNMQGLEHETNVAVLRGDSFLLIYFLPVMVFLYTKYVVRHFVCDSAAEFGAMGSTSFVGFSYPNLLLVFSEPVILGTCIIFFSQVLGLSLGLFFLFFCTLFWISL